MNFLSRLLDTRREFISLRTMLLREIGDDIQGASRAGWNEEQLQRIKEQMPVGGCPNDG